MEESYTYKHVLEKIKKIEMSIMRLKKNGFLVHKYEIELKDIIVINRLNSNIKDCTINYAKIYFDLNELQKHLNRLEKIGEYYEYTKFRLNTNGQIKLFLDCYVNDTLDIINLVNDEIKEYGLSSIKMFDKRFYALVYFLIKLEIAINDESEIYNDVIIHNNHFHCLNELVMSDINRIFFDEDKKKKLKEKLKVRKYDNFVEVIIEILEHDKKIRRVLDLNVNNSLVIRKKINK